MKRTLATALLLVSALVLGASVSAQPMGGPGGLGGPGGPGGPPIAIDQVLKNALDFSDAQLMSFKALAEARKASADALQAKIGDAQKALGDALAAGTTDPTTIGTLFLAVHGLQTQMPAIDETFKAGVRALLTSAQTQKLADIKAATDNVRAGQALAGLDLF
jgi:Heavy-metal resistance